MAKWLFKSEPDVFSLEQLQAAGKSGTEWTGIRNYAARNHMRAMKLGDQGFFYYSNDGKAIVGIAEVCKLAHVDSTADNPTWECVDIRFVAALPKPVTLDEIKQNKKLAKMVLINNSRLSVQPVADDEWAEVCRMAGMK
jgi:predicted RNA-binding protein with PUA-like domain